MKNEDEISLDSIKSIFLSKTFWFNLGAGAFAVAESLDAGVLTTLGVPAEKQPVILTVVGAVVALVNMILRTRTSSAVSVKLPKFKKNADPNASN